METTVHEEKERNIIKKKGCVSKERRFSLIFLRKVEDIFIFRNRKLFWNIFRYNFSNEHNLKNKNETFNSWLSAKRYLKKYHLRSVWKKSERTQSYSHIFRVHNIFHVEKIATLNLTNCSAEYWRFLYARIFDSFLHF